jgi:hypothetical protein
MVASATSVKELNFLKQRCNPLNVTVQVPRKHETCVGLDEKKNFLVFRKDKESVINVGILLQICLKVLEMKQLSLQA